MANKEITDRILENIKEGKNSLIWKQNTINYLPFIKERYRAVYINETTPLKPKLANIIIEVSKMEGRKNIETFEELQKPTVPVLKETLKSRNRHHKLVIVFNHFEKLTPTAKDFWMSLSGDKYIILVGSQFGTYKSHLYGFYKLFEIVNKKEREEQREINITIPVMVGLGFIAFVCFIKVSIMNTELLFIIFFSFSLIRFLMYFAK